MELLGSLIVEKYSISQNYPKPFNAHTKIEFTTPVSAYINLTIYDNLGKEVTKLVNEYLLQRTYRVDWGASGQTAGIYFYTFICGEFKETKKMILVK